MELRTCLPNRHRRLDSRCWRSRTYSSPTDERAWLFICRSCRPAAIRRVAGARHGSGTDSRGSVHVASLSLRRSSRWPACWADIYSQFKEIKKKHRATYTNPVAARARRHELQGGAVGAFLTRGVVVGAIGGHRRACRPDGPNLPAMALDDRRSSWLSHLGVYRFRARATDRGWYRRGRRGSRRSVLHSVPRSGPSTILTRSLLLMNPICVAPIHVHEKRDSRLASPSLGAQAESACPPKPGGGGARVPWREADDHEP